MRSNEKAPGGGQTPTGAVVETGTISDTHITMSERGMQASIASLLGVGEQNAIRAQRLAELAGCRSVRQLQERIAEEVAETGALILCCADGRGYFLAGNRTELLQYEAALRKRAVNTFRRLRSVKAALRQVDGQMVVEDDDGRSAV